MPGDGKVKVTEDYLLSLITSKYFDKLKLRDADALGKNKPQVSTYEKLMELDSEAVKDAIKEHVRKEPEYKAVLGRFVGKTMSKNADKEISNCVPDVSDGYKNELESDLSKALNMKGMDLEQWRNKLNEMNISSESAFSALDQALKELEDDVEKQNQEKENVKVVIVQEKIKRVMEESGKLEGTFDNGYYDGILFDEICKNAGKVLKALRKDEEDAELEARLLARAEFYQEVKVTNDHLEEKIQTEQTKLQEVLKQVDSPEVDKEQVAQNLAETTAAMLVQKTMQKMLEKGKDFLSPEDLEKMKDENLVKNSVADMVKAKSFQSTVANMSKEKLNDLANDEKEVEENGQIVRKRGYSKVALDNMYDDLVKNMSQVPCENAPEESISKDMAITEEDKQKVLKNEEKTLASDNLVLSSN